MRYFHAYMVSDGSLYNAQTIGSTLEDRIRLNNQYEKLYLANQRKHPFGYKSRLQNWEHECNMRRNAMELLGGEWQPWLFFVEVDTLPFITEEEP